ncbi:MAG: hypothetical protein ACRDZY_01105 [Acidimicrobiales bacterium]
MTPTARAALATWGRRQAKWAAGVASGIAPDDLAATLRTLRALRERLADAVVE